MSIAPNADRRYTYRDYLTWPGDERWELIEGIPYAMSPAPTIAHQAILFELGGQIRNLLLGKPCRGFVSPVDVRIGADVHRPADADTVVQPDLFIVCDSSKFEEGGVRGAPDFIIEILSPSTASHDQITKAALYEKHGVREYWVVDPVERLITKRVLSPAGTYERIQFIQAAGKVAMSIFPDFEIDFDLVFPPQASSPAL